MHIEGWLTFRVQRVRKEKLKNRSIYEILGKLNQMDNRLSMLRDQKLKKMRKQKDKVRNYSLQVNFHTFHPCQPFPSKQTHLLPYLYPISAIRFSEITLY